MPDPVSPRFTPSRLTLHRAWHPVSEDEWLALAPYLRDPAGPGRPIPDLHAIEAQVCRACHGRDRPGHDIALAPWPPGG